MADNSVGSILEHTAADGKVKRIPARGIPTHLGIIMTYNPDIHHRRTIRLRNYDYSHTGAYFVTLCTFDRSCYFDQFPQLRELVNNEWNNIPTRFHNVDLDEYVIMPNHFHGIINISRDTPRGYPDTFDVGAVSCARPIHAGCPQEKPGCPQEKPGHPQGDAPTLGDIIGAFKSLCVNAWLRVIKTENVNARGKFWLNNYYEHVIRNEDEMNRIRQYVVDNPAQWELDRENPVSCGQQQVEKWMI